MANKKGTISKDNKVIILTCMPEKGYVHNFLIMTINFNEEDNKKSDIAMAKVKKIITNLINSVNNHETPNSKTNP